MFLHVKNIKNLVNNLLLVWLSELVLNNCKLWRKKKAAASGLKRVNKSENLLKGN